MLTQSTKIRDLLRKLNKTVGMMVTKELSKYGVTMPQLLILRQIACEAKTIGQLSKAVDLSYSTVSGIIDRLEREKYVERIRDKDDRRVIWIQKTAKIDEVMNQTPFFSESYYNELFGGLSESDLDSIIHSMQTLISKLEEKVEEKP